MNLNVIPINARNLLVALGVRFLAPLEMIDTTIQIMLLWLYFITMVIAFSLLLTGGTIIGLISGLISYFGSRWFFWTVKKRRAMKHRLDNLK